MAKLTTPSNILFGVAGATFLFYVLILPQPSDMASFWVGCSAGNFQPSNTCLRVCRMLGNLSSCCFGVNYSGRTACSCCAQVTACPQNCNSSCVMVSIATETCGGNNEGAGAGAHQVVDVKNRGALGAVDIMEGLFEGVAGDLIRVPKEMEGRDPCSSGMMTSGPIEVRGEYQEDGLVGMKMEGEHSRVDGGSGGKGEKGKLVNLVPLLGSTSTSTNHIVQILNRNASSEESEEI